jgi:hypothetical protein
MLSLESVAFDLLFIVQHYILYRANNRRMALQALNAPLLTRQQQEALEAETQALAAAKAAAAVAVLGAVVPIGALIGGGGGGAAAAAEKDSYQSVATNSNGDANGSGAADLESPRVDGEATNSVNLPVRRGSDSQRTHLLPHANGSGSGY